MGQVTPTKGPHAPPLDPDPEAEPDPDPEPLSLATSEGVLPPPVGELELHAGASARPRGTARKHIILLMTHDLR